jgi:Lipase maturation factor
MNLLHCDPFHDEKEKPRYIRIDKYRYSFSRKHESTYWDRELIGQAFPREGAASMEDLEVLVQLWNS